MAKVDTNRNLVAALAYVPFFSIFLSVVILLVEKDDKFIRFHALQALTLSVCYYFFSVILSLVLGRGILALLDTFLSPLWALAFLVIWVISMVKAYQGEIMKWPLVGEFAERRVR